MLPNVSCAKEKRSCPTSAPEMATIEMELWQKTKWVSCYCAHLKHGASARNVRQRKHAGNKKQRLDEGVTVCDL